MNTNVVPTGVEVFRSWKVWSTEEHALVVRMLNLVAQKS